MSDLMSNFSGPGVRGSQFMARQRIDAKVNVPRLFAVIDGDPSLVGAGVVYIDADYNVVVLREFQPICSTLPKRIVLRELKRYLTPEQFTEQLQNSPRESKVFKEAFSTTAACIGAVIGWSVVFSGTIAAPFTAGTSLVLTYIGGAAVAASAAQCGFGMLRTVREVTNPAANDEMDESQWYQVVSPMLDAVALMGVAASGLTTVRYLLARRASTGSSWWQLRQTLSRQQRKALTDELLSIKHPSLTANQLKLQQAAGGLTKRYTPTQISHATQTLFKDCWGMGLGLVGSSSMQSIAIGLYEEF